jgi:uncharacterized YigZ family protein
LKTIISNSVNEILIKNSKFITLLIKIDSSNINDYLDKIKKDYPKATHYCYAYIYGDVKHCSDDGEPGSTAGMPMLNVLEKEGMMNVLCVVVRYFGGIKLGAGGLVRAYSKSVKEAIDNSNIRELQYGYKVSIEINYDDKKDFEYIIRNEEIINVDYDLTIKYLLHIKKENLDIINRFPYTVIDEEYY